MLLSFEYRITGRGGKRIVGMSVYGRNGKLVAFLPVEGSDQIVLVSDKGQLIRCSVEGIRIAGHSAKDRATPPTGLSTKGLIVFDTGEGERAASVAQLEMTTITMGLATSERKHV